jgi:hypothetical protein
VLTPVQVLTDPGHAPAVLDATRALPGVYGVLRTSTSADAARGITIVDVLPARETNAGAGAALIDRIRHATAQ